MSTGIDARAMHGLFFFSFSAAKRLVPSVPRRLAVSGLGGSRVRGEKWGVAPSVRCAVATESAAQSASTREAESLEETWKGEEERIVLPTNESSDRLLRICHTVSELINAF